MNGVLNGQAAVKHHCCTSRINNMLSVSNLYASMELPWLVCKFGGTSVGTAERLVAVADIIASQLEHHRPVLVCSAMSSVKKTSGTTSLLLRASELALHSVEEAGFLALVDEIELNHHTAARQAIDGAAHAVLLVKLVDGISMECARLKDLLRAVRVLHEVSPRSRDLIVSTGERLSCQLMTAVLDSQGVDAVYINADRVVAPDAFDDAESLGQPFYDHVSKRLRETIEAATASGAVPVVTGFFGPVPGSLLTAVGRGYTDLAAALAAVGLGAAELQIWKEVDGIFSADPRKVPTAHLIAEITADEAAELTYYGSEVIHPLTMDQVLRAGVPIRIKNTFHPQGNGTLIILDYRGDLEKPGGLVGDSNDAGLAENGSNGSLRDRPMDFTVKHGTPNATAVTIKDNIVVVNIRSNRKSNTQGFLSSIFTILDRHGVVADLITTSEVHVSLALPLAEDDVLTAEGEPKSLAKVMAEFRRLGIASILPRQVILSVVGRYMRNMVGTAGSMFSILASAGVNIEMISQGASEINISCVIAQEASLRALRAVHDRLVRGGAGALSASKPVSPRAE